MAKRLKNGYEFNLKSKSGDLEIFVEIQDVENKKHYAFLRGSVDTILGIDNSDNWKDKPQELLNLKNEYIDYEICSLNSWFDDNDEQRWENIRCIDLIAQAQLLIDTWDMDAQRNLRGDFDDYVYPSYDDVIDEIITRIDIYRARTGKINDFSFDIKVLDEHKFHCEVDLDLDGWGIVFESGEIYNDNAYLSITGTHKDFLDLAEVNSEIDPIRLKEYMEHLVKHNKLNESFTLRTTFDLDDISSNHLFVWDLDVFVSHMKKFLTDEYIANSFAFKVKQDSYTFLWA